MGQACFPFSLHPWSSRAEEAVGEAEGGVLGAFSVGEKKTMRQIEMEDHRLFHSSFSPSHQASGWGGPEMSLKSSISQTFYQISLWDFDA